MYNRYVPQSDGTYQRNRMPDSVQKPSAPQQTAPAPPAPACIPQEPARCPSAPLRPRPKPPCREPAKGSSILSFFRNLLPENFDTGDLLVVLLLLLIGGDCQEDQNTALLTLVLYLFL